MKDMRDSSPAEAPDLAEIDLEQIRAGSRLVDVRSPGEFAEDHLPEAISVPLLDDPEREVVGTLFRNQGPGPAQAWGEARVHARLDEFTRKLQRGLDLPASGESESPPPRVVYCARGGARSAAVTRHLRRLGHPVVRLRGGYRAYRTRIRADLAGCNVPGPVVLNGLTGCGKTRVLREIARIRHHCVVDLEELAGHRSSLFGDIGLEPTSQKTFESHLVRELSELTGPWSLFESEARRIGDREMPKALYERLRSAPKILLTATMEQRVELLCDEYLQNDGVAEVRRRLPALECYPAIGARGVQRLDELLAAGDVSTVARELLRLHYDPRYRHGSDGLEVAHRIRFRDVAGTAAEILGWIDSHWPIAEIEEQP